jgi:hypothetical protein
MHTEIIKGIEITFNFWPEESQSFHHEGSPPEYELISADVDGYDICDLLDQDRVIDYLEERRVEHAYDARMEPDPNDDYFA